MARRLIGNRRAGNFTGISLNRRIEHFAHPLQLVVHALFHIAIAVIVDFRAFHAHIAQIFDGGHIFMTVGAGFNFDF